MEFKKLFLFTIFILPVTLFAQDKPDTLKFTAEQVVVSATRYPEMIFELPYAITSLNKKDLSNIRGYGMDEVMAQVPGVLAQSRSGHQDIRLVIRGFGARGAGDRSNAGTTRGIRIMVDGIPETEPDGRTSFDQIDLSMATNIEIIRSNSSALWGNAAGGVINITTMPVFVGNYAGATMTYGSYGFNKALVQAGKNFGSGKVFLSFSNVNNEGWRDRSSGYRSLFNLAFESELSENSKFGAYASAASSSFHISGPLTQKQFDANSQMSNTTYAARDERRFNRLGRIGLTLDMKLDKGNSLSGMVFANPKYLQRSERGTFRDFTRYHIGGNLLWMNQTEFSGNVESRFIAGIDEAYQDGAILFYNLSPENQRGDSLRTNKREGANTFGAFFQEEIVLGDNLSIIAGGRYDKVTYYSEEFANSNRGDVARQTALGAQEKEFTKFTPKAGITFRFSKFHSLYLNIGGGVEVPAGNETDPAPSLGYDTVYGINPLLEPITSSTYELGTKQVIGFSVGSLIRTLTYDAALYFIRIANDIIPYSGGRFYFTAGKTDRIGLELGLDAQLVHGLSFNSALTYSSNRYVEYTIDSVHFNNPGKIATYTDNKVAGIPDLFYNAGVKYSPEFLSGAYISMSMNGMGEYFADDANKYSVPSYTTFNASIGFGRPYQIYDGLTVRGFLSVNNITNAKYAASAFINPDLITEGGAKVPVYLEPGMPRHFTLSVALGWN
ncbi:MAG: TonB-dependent receptor [Ignavibacteriaceae bacterium]|nr:TonB-dependent receptor [Ignavibacteriaceae bacterium]